MIELAAIARWIVGVIAGLLLLAVAVQALTGRINVAGVLRNKSTNALDPGRLQLLILTALTAIAMVTQLDEMRAKRTVFLPSDVLLYLMGGSEGLYLVRKYLQGVVHSRGA